MSGNLLGRPRHEVIREIRAFLLRTSDLPSPQGTAMRLIEVARNPDVSLDEIVDIVKTDPALTALILRAASSARFHGMPTGLNIHAAVQRLGLYSIRIHALVLSLTAQSARMRCEGFNYHLFWTASLHTAILTEALAGRIAGRTADDGFALGLLARVGELALATAQPDEYSRLIAFARKSGSSLDALEREVFGFDHDELSAVLMTDWELPPSMADVVYWQQDPEGGGFAFGSTQYLLASCLRLASMLSNHILDTPDGDDLQAARRRADLLGIEAATLQEIIDESLPPLREWTYLIGLPMPLIDTRRLLVE